MADFQTEHHNTYDIKYQFAWLTRDRCKVLQGAIAKRARTLLAMGCEANRIKILSGHISPDHVQMIVSCPPSLSPKTIMKILKGISSQELQTEFSELKKQYWGQNMWERDYYCATVGAADDESVRDYIEHHNVFEIPKSFTIEDEEPVNQEF